METEEVMCGVCGEESVNDPALDYCHICGRKVCQDCILECDDENGLNFCHQCCDERDSKREEGESMDSEATETTPGTDDPADYDRKLDRIAREAGLRRNQAERMGTTESAEYHREVQWLVGEVRKLWNPATPRGE